MAYTVLAASLTRAKERCQGRASDADDVWLTEMLELSAGTDAGGITHYRPYYVAAKFLEQTLADQTVASADGAVFTGLVKPIASLMALQAAYDQAKALTIPAGFEAQTAEAALLPQRTGGVVRATLNP